MESFHGSLMLNLLAPSRLPDSAYPRFIRIGPIWLLHEECDGFYSLSLGFGPDRCGNENFVIRGLLNFGILSRTFEAGRRINEGRPCYFSKKESRNVKGGKWR